MLTLKNIINRLQKYWENIGCILLQPCDIEVGAGTFHNATFFNSLSKKYFHWRAIYIQKCRRPEDNTCIFIKSNKLQNYYQFQVIIKPAIKNIIDIYIRSLKYLKINLKKNDLKFIEDNWENSTLGAWGLGWEVCLNGIEITQITYFKQIGGINCNPNVLEITYGLERLAMQIQNKSNIYNIILGNLNNKKLLYKHIYLKNEIQYYYFNSKYIKNKISFFILYEYKKQIIYLIKLKLFFPAYELLLKSIHIFNILDSKNIFSNIERTEYMLNFRNLSCNIIKLFLNINK